MKSFSILLTFVSLAFASPTFWNQDGQIPMGAETSGYDLDLSERRLIELEGQAPVWVTEGDKIRLKAEGKNFFDITETPHIPKFQTLVPVSYPKPNATETVKAIISTLSTAGPQENLKAFSGFRTRYYRSDTGRQSQQWLLSKVNEVTTKYASKALRKYISIKEFPHPWKQNSIIVRINGSSETDDRAVIISAHQDSTNMWPFLPAPGADDDGSGTVTILESYRALLASDFRPVRPVEFHWYSAEEGGLLGSQAVAKEYASEKREVYAMSQFDMTAWVKRGTREEVGIITDFTDGSLTAFNKELVNLYLDIPYVETKCGYACSDHASWGKAGYPSTFTIESSFENSNPNIHSANDRIDYSDEFSFEHMLEFSKLAVAFAVELGGVTKSY